MKQILFKLLFFCAMLFSHLILAQTTVTGTITDATDGTTLPGVNIIEKGTSNGVTSDFDGNYNIEVTEGATLQFSFIGYTTQDIKVNGKSTINVVLAESAEALGEVVVTALGISKEKKALGYATATISADQITQTATPDFATALYGKAAGVQITATPGGSTSASNITIRGIASITGRSQPLIVLDGVPIRDGEVSNTSYWSDQRIQGNGLLDINPDDVADISILKGASAAALYGSEATNGVIIITTKGAKKGTKGITVDFNASYTTDKVAYLPDYQNVRGPGYPLAIRDAGQDADGFVFHDTNGDGNLDTKGVIGTNLNYGPKFDGQPIVGWDGIVRPYEAQPGYEGLFQDAQNTRVNVSVSNVSDKSRVRFSYTRQDNEGISEGSKDGRNIVDLNTSFDWSDNFRTDVQVKYYNQKVSNRPYKVDRLINNFDGMMTRFDNADWYRNKYQTSDGYRYVRGTSKSTTPDENIIIPGSRNSILDYFWRLNKHNRVENSNRLIGILTTSWDITKGLNLRARVSSDYTNKTVEDKRSTERPTVFYARPGGYFGMNNNTFQVNYGEVLLSYTREITPDLDITAQVGYNASEEKAFELSRGTKGGLSVRDWFDISASLETPANSGSKRSSLVKDAMLATLDMNYKDMLYIQGTVRRDRTSTMHPDNNSFVYPSINASFVFSEAFEMPEFISFGKIRAAYGIVGNYPDAYRANIAYSQNSLGDQGSGTVIYNTISNSFGNDGIKPEEKREYEFGLEFKFFRGRLNFDASYYNAQVIDQILPLTLPNSSGASSVLTNIGTLRNKGYELMLNGTPIVSENFTWDATVNFSKNENKVEALAPGLDEIQHANWDGDAAKMVSTVGQPMGDIYSHPILTDDNGNKIVDPNGLYRVDASKHVKYGNAMPKWIGGFFNTFRYKNFSFNSSMDFRIGGHVMPTGLNWMIGRGLTTESLKGMDAASGGLSYYEDANGDRFRTDAATGPNGEVVHDNGIILDGVKLDGSPNDYISSNPEYYWNVYNWGGPQYSPNTRYELYIKENSYLKMRELSLAYDIPTKALEKIGLNRLQISIYGRNLFYLYRTIKDIDAEQTTAGSRWTQNVNNLGNNPATKSYGIMIRAGL